MEAKKSSVISLYEKYSKRFFWLIDFVSSKNDSSVYIISKPDEPWSPHWYLSVRGAECFHIYLWIAKDWSWTQDWYWQGLIFGSAAVVWSFFLLSHSASKRNYQEVWHGIGQILWLFANLWWMEGELHDVKFPGQPPINDARQKEGGYIMITALCWLGIYYLFLRPFGLLPISTAAKAHYDDTGLSCRFSSCFPTWRQYENIHIVFWLGKDCAWNTLIPVMWIVFLVPTVLVALDFVICATSKKVQYTYTFIS